MHLVLHGGVLRRHSESIPSHWVQDVEAPRALVTGHNVTHRVVAHVADVNAPRRIGEHFQDIVFWPWIIVLCNENRGFVPLGLPVGFGFLRVVTLRCARSRSSVGGCHVRAGHRGVHGGNRR